MLTAESQDIQKGTIKQSRTVFGDQ